MAGRHHSKHRLPDLQCTLTGQAGEVPFFACVCDPELLLEGCSMKNYLYLIQNIRDNGDLYYAEHGEMGGLPDAIGYDTLPHARKFRTYEEAQAYIGAQLPAWARACHRIVALDAAAFAWQHQGISALLAAGALIPVHFLMPTPNQLRIWRH